MRRQSINTEGLRQPYTFLLVFTLILTITFDALAFDLDKLKGDLAAYQNDLSEIARDAGAIPQPLPLFIMYLTDNQASAATVREFVAQNPAELPTVKELEKFNRKRYLVDKKLSSSITSGTEEFRLYQREDKSWRDHLYPYLEEIYVRSLVVKKRLYEYKYFEEDDPKQANLLEGWLNSKLPLTRYRNEQAWYRQSGVSAWEITTRVEPLVLLENSNHPGVLATAGMLYNFFPEVSAGTGEGRFQTIVKDDFISKNLKRTGLKAGIGALFDDPNTELLAGIGLQLRAWSLWGVYSTGSSKYSLAVSLSDWDWLKKLLPLFQ